MKLDPIVKKILNKRGICAEADIVEFLSDKPRKTYDPFLLPDMEAGVDLILSETGKGSKICVYGDYDADGITSTVLMMTMLSHDGPSLSSQENLQSSLLRQKPMALSMPAFLEVSEPSTAEIQTANKRREANI